VTTVNSIHASVGQFTTFVTIGVSDRFDVSLAVPIVTADLKVVSDATIQRLGTTDPLTHFFRQSNGDVGNERLFTAAASASGLGDVTLRLKGTVKRKNAAAVAAGLDFRLPTGDEMNLLGTGAAGLEPFLIFSGAFQKIAPHANVSYQWNGSSVLAGNPATGESADFPDQVGYAVGTEISVSTRLTLAIDVLGRYVINGERLRQEDFHALDGKSVFPNIVFSRDSFQTLSGALGFKVNVFSRLLIDANLLFALDNNGIRDKVTPLVGFEYTF
jgi:hypothetical protein